MRGSVTATMRESSGGESVTICGHRKQAAARSPLDRPTWPFIARSRPGAPDLAQRLDGAYGVHATSGETPRRAEIVDPPGRDNGAHDEPRTIFGQERLKVFVGSYGPQHSVT